MSDRRRPFTPIDGLILAASFALGVAGAVRADPGSLALLVHEASPQGSRPGMPAWARDLELPSKRVRSDFGVFLALMSLGVGVATFRRGPGWRRRGGFPSPGVAASAAAATALLAYFALDVIWIARFTRRGFVPATSWATYWMVETWRSSDFHPSTKAASVAGAILGVWAYLVLARAWRPRNDWRDWLGRWLGWCWLGHTASVALFMALWG